MPRVADCSCFFVWEATEGTHQLHTSTPRENLNTEKGDISALGGGVPSDRAYRFGIDDDPNRNTSPLNPNMLAGRLTA